MLFGSTKLMFLGVVQWYPKCFSKVTFISITESWQPYLGYLKIKLRRDWIAQKVFCKTPHNKLEVVGDMKVKFLL